MLRNTITSYDIGAVTVAVSYDVIRFNEGMFKT